MADPALIDVDADIAEAEAQLLRLRARRRRISKQPEAAMAAITRAASLGACAMPPPANQSLDLASALYRDSAERAPPWCPAKLHPPNASSLSELAAARAGQPGCGAVTVLPSLLAPCCAHSGTTFLWKCLSYALHPDKACSRGPPPGRRPGPRHASDAPYASNWTSAACGARKYLLPGLTGNIHGHWDYRKEWFFYGGGGASFAKGWDDYAGIELPLCYWEKEFQARNKMGCAPGHKMDAHTANNQMDIPLCYWEKEFQIRLRESPLVDSLAQSRRQCVVQTPTATPKHPSSSSLSAAAAAAAAAIMWEEQKLATPRARRQLRPPGRRLSPLLRWAAAKLKGPPAVGAPCLHRTCLPYDATRIQFGPRFAPEAAAGGLARIQFQPTKALPRLDPATHPGAVVPDFTPNYLCSSVALRNVLSTVGTPKHWKMVVVHRSPYDALRSSYKMFVQWGWVRSDNLTADVSVQLSQLRECNETLYDDPETLGAAPDAEILKYFARCWPDGVWKRYVPNSLHYVCLRAWLAAGFDRSQFLLVKSERLRTMTAHELVSGVSNFTGLHYNQQALNSRPEEFRAQCEAADSAANREAAARRDRDGSAPMINSHSAYTGRNAQQRSRLAQGALQEFERLADAYVRLMDGLGLQQL